MNVTNSYELAIKNTPLNFLLLDNAYKSNQLQNIFFDCLLKLTKDEEDFVIKIFRSEICNREKLSDVDFMKSLFDYICLIILGKS